ncbi:C2 calcium-dependent domain-containing protein 4C-like [Amphiprion ocellaris]|uniref:C2 calcium-dependent domain-containing protein 4C-like n=1 Tax=Amphiprion ocellaris TaxID=80972 RepID=UPI000C302FE1|nr:C2 calcium-dependent domain-containing protein 4C-like [Amphiprion ocellaris]XP_054868039.1 C2 calcium-dependent domain-containing protein 4C-like [Amphiprion ocellaris]XP_054868040.1 C2 calcium-dependent domain-containing protein 4C-like [Amphiprion ocellaris]
MSSVKPRSSLRSLVLTPDRIPSFFILSSLSPQPQRAEPDRIRLLSDHDEAPPTPASSHRHLLRPRHGHSPAESADTDLTTRAAMSLSHVPKVTTPYGFSAALAASPCTNRRESLFHRNRPVMVTVTEPQEAADPSPSGSSPSGTRSCFQPVKALGLQVIKELRRPAAALKALSPAARRTAHR